jgi:hypothetical protein
MLNIFSDDFCADLISDGPRKISIFPEFPAPQLPFDLGVFVEDRSRTQTLQSSHDLGNRVSWRKLTENMDMFRIHFHLGDFYFVLLGDLLKHSFHSLLQFTVQNLLPIFWRPD